MPVFDAAITADTNSTGNLDTATADLTVGSNDDRVVYAVLCTDNGTPTGVSATFGGNSMTHVGSATSSTQQVIVYRYINPASGSNTCNMSWTGTTSYAFFVASYYDVDQTNPERTSSFTTSGSAGSANVSMSVPSAVGDLVVAILSVNSIDAITDGAGQTRDAQVLQGGNGITGAVLNSEAGASGSVTMSWTHASERNGAAGWSLQAPVSAAVSASFLPLMGVG